MPFAFMSKYVGDVDYLSVGKKVMPLESLLFSLTTTLSK
jgi:hypothetical protein